MVPEIEEEVVAGMGRAADVLPVIGREAVRHDEVWTAVDCEPVGELIVVGVRIVQEAAFLDDEPARVLARAVPTIPAERTLTDRAGDRLDGTADVFSLRLEAQLLVPD